MLCEWEYPDCPWLGSIQYFGEKTHTQPGSDSIVQRDSRFILGELTK